MKSTLRGPHACVRVCVCEGGGGAACALLAPWLHPHSSDDDDAVYRA